MESLNYQIVKKDIIVVGGGVSGVCAAISAARNGVSVALVQDRPVLGGNSSSEIRVAPLGAMGGGNRFAEEMGIIGSFKLESLYKNPAENPHHWDAILLDNVLNEPNISLYLNIGVNEVQAENAQIKSVTGYQQGSETFFRFAGDLFIDCSGDGTVGYLAGAEFLRGSEGKTDFNESLADDQSKGFSLGHSFCFESVDTGKPVKFIRPTFAYSWEDIKDYVLVGTKWFDEKTQGFDFWWIEYGGMLDTITDNEIIRHELLKITYGVWDFIKNSGKFPAENRILTWIQSVPGKRESRRFIGDHILTQDDLEHQTNFPDAVCYGGWSIDRHPARGFFTNEPSSSHIWVDPYNIPLRSLYSKNINNLMFAGRNISATHIAMASTRLMNTCALEGQATGVAGAIAIKENISIREAALHHIQEIQQTILKQDGYYIGAVNLDEADKAKNALVSSSGFRAFKALEAESFFYIQRDLSIYLPAVKSVESFSLLIQSNTDTVLEAEVYLSSGRSNHRPVNKIGEFTFELKKSKGQWIDFNHQSKSLVSKDRTGGGLNLLTLPLENNKYNIICILKENENVGIGCAKCPCTGTGALYTNDYNLPFDFYPCFKVEGDTQKIYHHENVTNGYNRIYGLPNLWVSDPIKSEPAWITLDFNRQSKSHASKQSVSGGLNLLNSEGVQALAELVAEPLDGYKASKMPLEVAKADSEYPVNLLPESVEIKEIMLYFNPDFNREFYNIMTDYHKKGVSGMPAELVKGYEVSVKSKDKVVTVAKDNENWRRYVHLEFAPITAESITVKITETWGSAFAEIFEIRVY